MTYGQLREGDPQSCGKVLLRSPERLFLHEV